MIKHFYSSISNGEQVDCTTPQHYTPEPINLVKSNFLSEFRTALEKKKVRLNLGIMDSETLEWGAIGGDIANQTDIVGYVNTYVDTLLTFTNDKYPEITNVVDASLKCLDYLSTFEGEADLIENLQETDKKILKALFNVEDINSVNTATLTNGLFADINSKITNLQNLINSNDTDIDDLVSNLNDLEESVADLSDRLDALNITIEISKKPGNALIMADPGTRMVSKRVEDENGDPILDGDGQEQFVEVAEAYNKGYFVEDLKPILTAQGNTLSTTVTNLQTLQTNFLTLLNSLPTNYLRTNADGSVNNLTVASITSNNDTVEFKKPISFAKGLPGDARRYVKSYTDLKNFKVDEVWDGMEVIVIQTATMYILKNKNLLPNAEAWKSADALAIVELTFDEYKELYDNTDEEGKAIDGTKGTIDPGVYYYIKETPILFENAPDPADAIYNTGGTFDLVKYTQDLQTWEKTTWYLQGQYVSAKWGKEFEQKLSTKASSDTVETINTKVNTEKARVDAIITQLQNLTEGDSSTLASINLLITQLRTDLEEVYKKGTTSTGILVDATDDIATIKLKLFGNSTTSAEFVTWEALGGGEGSQLGENETLFVKTSTYNENREDDTENFRTDKVTLEHEVTVTPAIPAVTHIATQEDVNADATGTLKVGDTVVDSPEVPEVRTVTKNTFLTGESGRAKVNNKALAFLDELIKKIFFTSYAEYFNWINAGATIEGLGTYADWSAGKVIDDWYFVIKNYNGVLPTRLSSDTDETYQARLSLFKDSILMTLKEAEEKFQPKGAYASEGFAEGKANAAKATIKSYVDSGFVPIELWDLINEETQVKYKLSEVKEQVIAAASATAIAQIPNQVTSLLATKLNTSDFEALYNIINGTTGKRETLSAIVSSLNSDIDKKVSLTAYDTKVSQLETSIGLKANASDMTTELGKKLDTETYNSDMTNLRTEVSTQISTEVEKVANSATITYALLLTMISESKLNPGRKYRITDYETTCNTESEDAFVLDWHPFDIIVEAVSENAISSDAKVYSSQAYYANNNLSAWKIKYTTDNIYWSKTAENGGKGTIFYMLDEFGNECTYDFKNIVFRRFKVIDVGTASSIIWLKDKKLSSISLDLQSLYTNNMVDYVSANGTLNTVLDIEHFYTFNTSLDERVDASLLGTVKNNKFASDCNISAILARRSGIVLGHNVFIGTTTSNNNCVSANFMYNTILDNAKHNTFGTDFIGNIVGIEAEYNSFGNNCLFNIIENQFKANIIGNSFQKNYISNNCSNNNFLGKAVSNVLKENCSYNVMNTTFNHNELAANNSHNNFMGNNEYLKIQISYCRLCTFNAGVRNLNITGFSPTQSSQLQNLIFKLVNISSGFNLDLSQTVRITTSLGEKNIELGAAYYTEIDRDMDGNIRAIVVGAMVPLVAELSSQVNGLNSVIEGLNTTIQSLQTTLQDLESRVSTLENE